MQLGVTGGSGALGVRAGGLDVAHARESDGCTLRLCAVWGAYAALGRACECGGLGGRAWTVEERAQLPLS